MPLNVLGHDLAPCSHNPLTGFIRDGCCQSLPNDSGMHLICVVVTEEFLLFSQSRGNDLITPVPQYQFPGLTPGDQWCLCLQRWQEALQADCAPPVVLEATHLSVTEFIDRTVLEEHRAY